MGRFRFSLRALMILIVLLSIAFAALHYPTPFWANVWFSLDVACLTLAIPAAVYRGGATRAFLVGFAACGWVYFVLALMPWFEKETGFQLLTTTLLDLLGPHIVSQDDLIRGYAVSLPAGRPAEPTLWSTWNLPDFPPQHAWSMGYVTLHSSGVYLRIGHAVSCVLLAILGGILVRYLAMTRSQPAGMER